jgi:hypothetical protein
LIWLFQGALRIVSQDFYSLNSSQIALVYDESRRDLQLLFNVAGETLSISLFLQSNFDSLISTDESINGLPLSCLCAVSENDISLFQNAVDEHKSINGWVNLSRTEHLSTETRGQK